MADVRLLELRNTYKWGGGPDKTILLSAERHDPARVEVVVAYVRDAADAEFNIADRARGHGFEYYEIKERGKLDLRVLRALRQIVLRHRINVVHAHDYKSDLFAYLLRQSLRTHVLKLVSTAHAWVMVGLRGEIYRRLDLRLMRRFDQLVAVSHATREEMVAGGVPSELVKVVHNGIDTDAWSPSRTLPALKKELGIPSGVPLVGYVGRIMPEKDLDTWLRAAAIAARQYPSARFVLVGEGKDDLVEVQLRRLAQALGIAERVNFLGYRSDLLSIYASFELFVLTSRREGLPNSILEAMAMGLPVVTTDVAGAKELVRDGWSGFVLPQGDVPGIARGIITLLGRRELSQKMGARGRKLVEDEFSFDRRLRRMEDLYESVLGLSARQMAPTLRTRAQGV